MRLNGLCVISEEVTVLPEPRSFLYGALPLGILTLLGILGILLFSWKKIRNDDQENGKEKKKTVQLLV